MIFKYTPSKQGPVNTYLLYGDLVDRSQADGLLKEIDEKIALAENKILLNLADLKYLNSSGLNIMINILTKARRAGGEVAICNVNKKIQELLVITKLNSVFNVCESLEEGIAMLSK